MREGWEIKKLGEVATILNGYAFDSKLFSEDVNDIPLIRIRDIQRGYTETYYKGTYSDIYIINRGDYLIGMDGEFNIAEWNGPKALLNQRVCKISACGISKKYLYWYVSIVLKQIEDATPFVTVKHLSSKRLLNANILIPPLCEQERIVAELDLLSDVIAKKREQLKQLDTLAQSIFYDMFGDPITNEKGWETKKLGEISTSQIGITYKPEDVSDNEIGTIVLRSGNIQNNSLCFNDIIRVNKDIREDKYVKDGDILMCSRNGSSQLVGKVAMITKLKERMTYGAFMTVIRSDYQPFLFAFFKSPAFSSQLTTAKTATINQITIRMLEDIQVILPPLTIQQEFASKIEAIDKQKELIKQSLSEVQQLFDSRMDYYFN